MRLVAMLPPCVGFSAPHHGGDDAHVDLAGNDFRHDVTMFGASPSIVKARRRTCRRCAISFRLHQYCAGLHSVYHKMNTWIFAPKWKGNRD
jgi:hypothetical protein